MVYKGIFGGGRGSRNPTPLLTVTTGFQDRPLAFRVIPPYFYFNFIYPFLISSISISTHSREARESTKERTECTPQARNQRKNEHRHVRNSKKHQLNDLEGHWNITDRPPEVSIHPALSALILPREPTILTASSTPNPLTMFIVIPHDHKGLRPTLFPGHHTRFNEGLCKVFRESSEGNTAA